MVDTSNAAPEPLGWVRFDEDPWEQATFAVSAGSFGVRRATGATSWISLSDIRRIDETAPEADGWAQIELVLTDSHTVGAKLTMSRLDELLAVMSAAPRPDAPRKVQSAPPADPWAATQTTGSLTGTQVGGSTANTKLLLVVGGAFVALVLISMTVATGWWLMTRGGDHTIEGVYVLFDDSGDIDGEIGDCEGSGGYSDFSSGSDVKVRDAEGRIVGSATLEDPSDLEVLYERVAAIDESFADADEAEATFNEANGFICPLVFEVVVPDSDVYELEIATGRRGTQTYTREELEEDDWLVSIFLGN